MHVMPGEIKIWPGETAPAGWMFCRGQTLDISAHEQLFGILGNRYGGDGITTFNLPDLQESIIVGATPGVPSTVATATTLVTNAGDIVQPENAGGGMPSLYLNFIIALAGQVVSY